MLFFLTGFWAGWTVFFCCCSQLLPVSPQVMPWRPLLDFCLTTTSVTKRQRVQETTPAVRR